MTALTANTSQPSRRAEFVVRRVGVVGLGHMGHAFAVNLIEDGHQVFVYDRDPKRSAALAGASAAAGLADLAICDVVVTSLPDDDALAAVALGPGGLVGVLAPGAVHISTSTVSPGDFPPRRRGTCAPSPGLYRRTGARESGFRAGTQTFRACRRPALGAGEGPPTARTPWPTAVRYQAKTPRLANLVKLAANVLTATTLECMGEVLALIAKRRRRRPPRVMMC